MPYWGNRWRRGVITKNWHWHAGMLARWANWFLGRGFKTDAEYWRDKETQCVQATGPIIQGKPAPMPMDNFRTDRPIGPILLIALGVLFLVGRYVRIGYWIREAWPVVFIALGGWLLWKRMGRT